MFRISTALLLLVQFSAVCEDGFTPPTLVPVDPAKLQGSRLVLKSANAVIDAPGENWIWVTAKEVKGENYYCYRPDSETKKPVDVYAVTVFQLEAPLDNYVDGIIAGIEKAAEMRKAKLDGLTRKSCSIPFPGSFRLTYRFVYRDAAYPFVVYLTQTAMNSGLSVQDTRGPGAETETFTKFLKSIRQIKDPDGK